MHAVVTNVTISADASGAARLRDEIVPQVSGTPGFIAGYWVRLSGDKGTSIVAFDSEDSAQAMVNMIRDRPQTDESVTLDSIEVGEVVANA
jgi:hypothetical protein